MARGRILPVPRPRREAVAARAGLTLAGSAVLAATFLPWLGTGTGSRSSYDLLGVLARLGLTPDGPLSTLVEWWPLVPVTLTSAVVLAWWGRDGVAAVVALAGAAYTGGVAVALRVAARRAGVQVHHGVVLCAAASVALAVCALWLLLTRATGRGAPAPGAAAPGDPS